MIRVLPSLWSVLVVALLAPGNAVGCDSQPCLNGASCLELQNGTDYACDCSDGYEGRNCETNIDDCVQKNCDGAHCNVCKNGGVCTDLVNNFSCSCTFGYEGQSCDVPMNFSLVQWTSRGCKGTPFRCFKLQMDSCGDTGFTDGVLTERKNWFGKLAFDGGNHYTIDLCWDEAGDGEEQCKCQNHYANIPKLGKNSMGPPSDGLVDSDECHNLDGKTPSRLLPAGRGGNLTEGLSCEDFGAASRMQLHLVALIIVMSALREVRTSLGGT